MRMHTNDAYFDANKSQKLIYPDLSYVLTGICFDVHNDVGRHCKEKQYCDLLEEKFKERGLKYQREFKITDKGNILDFIVEDIMVLEAKAKPYIGKEDYNQLQRYLQSSKYKLGLLVNFRNRYIKPIRVVRIDTDTRKKFI